MASALPRLDPSAGRLVCRRPGCGASHLPEYDCPPVDTWLVAHYLAARSRRPR